MKKQGNLPYLFLGKYVPHGQTRYIENCKMKGGKQGNLL